MYEKDTSKMLIPQFVTKHRTYPNKQGYSGGGKNAYIVGILKDAPQSVCFGAIYFKLTFTYFNFFTYYIIMISKF